MTIIRGRPSFSVAVFVCAALLFLPHASAEEQTRFFVLDQPVITTLDNAPADIALVSMALVARMRGGEAGSTDPVRFAPSLAPRLKERAFLYSGFYVDAVSISHIGPANSWEAGRRLFGVLQFADELGRRAASRFGVEYLLDGEEIYISDASLQTVVPPESDIRLYVLPEARAEELFQLAEGTHVQALSFIAEHALDVSKESEMCACVLVAASFDRLPPGARLHAHVSDAGTGEKVMMGTHYVMNFSGWTIAGLSGQLDLSDGSPLALQAILSLPSDRSGEREPFQIVADLPVEETK